MNLASMGEALGALDPRFNLSNGLSGLNELIPPEQRVVGRALSDVMLPAGLLSPVLAESRLLGGLTKLDSLISGPSDLARALQGVDPYFGVDPFRDITLKKGTLIAAAIHSPDVQDLSGFFTTMSGLRRTLSGDVVDANRFNQGLQVFSARPEFRPNVGVFEVLEDSPAAFGLAKNNPQLNPGNYPVLPQVYLPDWSNRVRLIDSYATINTKAPVYGKK